MSDYFSGVTFPQQRVTPSDDAAIRRAVLADGILSGCEISYVGSTLTLGPGLMIACGRQFRHTAVQNFAVNGASSGYARLLLKIDTTKTSTKAAFEQIDPVIEYATALDGFTQLRQDDINESGTVYQMQICVVSLGSGGISGVVTKIGHATAAQLVRKTLYSDSWTASATAGFVQTVTVDGLTDEKKCRVYPAIPATLSEKLVLAEETPKIKAASRDGARITFEAWEEAPAANITVIVEVTA